jgi:hypothetical protein
MQSEERATYLAKLYGLKHKNVIAWARTADPNKDEFGEARVLFRKGRNPGNGIAYAEDILSRSPVSTTAPPQATDRTIGMVIRGYNLGAIKDGWLV